MSRTRSGALALVPNTSAAVAVEDEGRERRAYARVDPLELSDPIIARVKYSDTLTLIDVSAGGALFETGSPLRPDSNLVLEVMGAGAQDIVPVVSRVLRCEVASVRGGIRYRGACMFKRLLEHPALVEAPPPMLQTPPANFLKPEFALKTIVEGYRRSTAASHGTGTFRDPASLVESLEKLRIAAERRSDPVDRKMGQLIEMILPALQRNESADDVMGHVLEQLHRTFPVLDIRVGAAPRQGASSNQELITLNVWSDPDARAVTAEAPTGFDLDAGEFRLLKAGAYLVGLAESWVPRAPEPEVAAPPAPAAAPPPVKPNADLPFGWERVVVRSLDGTLLRGYSNDFHPERPHLNLSPEVASTVAERLHVPLARLKAIFFVRDLAGNPDQADSNVFDHTPRARKVEVTFRDGEVMVGSTLNYKPGGQGFFLTPANSRSNNRRVYVILSALRHMRFV